MVIAARGQGGGFECQAEGAARLREARGAVESLVARAGWLEPGDAALIRAVYEQGRSPDELCRLLAVDPRGLRRRIRRLADRAGSPIFLFVIRHQKRWPEQRRDVAAACILRGRSMREAARELGLPVYAVRRHLDVVRGMYEAAAGT